MSNSEQRYEVPQNIVEHPAWSRLEEQRAYFDHTASTCKTQFKRIKLLLIALSACIPLIVLMNTTHAAPRYIAAAFGVLIAILEGLLLVNQYATLWLKYRATAEELSRERWLLLAQAGDYADQQPDQAMRKLAARVEAILDTERKSWSEKQQEMLGALAKTQSFVQAHLDEATRRAAMGATALVQPDAAKALPPVPG